MRVRSPNLLGFKMSSFRKLSHAKNVKSSKNTDPFTAWYLKYM